MALTDEYLDIPEWTFGERLAKARKDGPKVPAGGLTQEQMAERLGVPASTLGAWEADRNRPRKLADLAREWSEVTGVDPAWLLGFRTGSFSPPLEVMADLFRVTEATVASWVRSGKIAAVSLPGGKGYRFRRTEVDDLVAGVEAAS